MQLIFLSVDFVRMKCRSRASPSRCWHIFIESSASLKHTFPVHRPITSQLTIEKNPKKFPVLHHFILSPQCKLFEFPIIYLFFFFDAVAILGNVRHLTLWLTALPQNINNDNNNKRFFFLSSLDRIMNRCNKMSFYKLFWFCIVLFGHICALTLRLTAQLYKLTADFAIKLQS